MKNFSGNNPFSDTRRSLKKKNCGGRIPIPNSAAAAPPVMQREKRKKNQIPKVAPAQSESGSG